jgi:hypothetical protein
MLLLLAFDAPPGWHTLRHTFGPQMKVNGEDVKTILELLRHANFKVTMDVYTQAVTEVKRTAQSRVVQQIMGEKEVADEEEWNRTFLVEPYQTLGNWFDLL